MHLPKVVLLDRGSFTVDLEVTRPSAPHRWEEYRDTGADQLVERLAGATAAITNGVGFPREVLRRLPDLKCISACSTGLDHIDTATCREAGIRVCRADDYATRTVAEHVFCLILALKRNLPSYLRDMAAGAWQDSGQYSLPSHPIGELHGGRLGILGGGAIGQAVARIGRGFGMEAVLAARKGTPPGGPPGDTERRPFDEVIETSDVITLHCPLVEETRDLIGWPEFQRMRRRPLIINTARGGLVNEAALVRALRAGLISGAGVDVASREPIEAGNPLLELTGDPRFVLTPHIGWASRQAQQAVIDQATANVDAFLRDRPA